jgi:hypothetical protein
VKVPASSVHETPTTERVDRRDVHPDQLGPAEVSSRQCPGFTRPHSNAPLEKSGRLAFNASNQEFAGNQASHFFHLPVPPFSSVVTLSLPCDTYGGGLERDPETSLTAIFQSNIDLGGPRRRDYVYSKRFGRRVS